MSRGAAFGDVDGDGGVDVLVSNNDGPARLFLNQAGARGHWISLRLKRNRGEPLGFGAQVTLVRERGERVRKMVGSDGSYASASDPRIHFGVGADTDVSGVEVTWPDGATEFFGDVVVNRENELVEGTSSRE